MIKSDVSEKTFQELFEAQLKVVFGWSDTNLTSRVPVQMGKSIKQADVVLAADNAKLVIEMKKPGVKLGISEALQTFSYMRILGTRYGLLIGDRITIIYDADPSADTPTLISDIPFVSSCEEGIALGQVLDYSTFTSARLEEYFVSHLHRQQSAKQMNKLKQDLVENNGSRIREIIRDQLLHDGHNENHVMEILAGIEIRDCESDWQAASTQTKRVLTHRVKPTVTRGSLLIGERPFKQYFIGESEVSSSTFEEYLRKHDAVDVEIEIDYSKRDTEKKIWHARNFSEQSNLAGNLGSGTLRNWREREIVAVRLSVGRDKKRGR
ncbi:MAG: type I restriction enzyme HsdR N-terminal domain-containing protein [Cellulomonadaceae bacterium]|nr:type I restriction enzyme HsdR N-terminal domain-containing protein [Cellulomonadaceae bacterium]